MAKVRVAIYGTPNKLAFIDPNATDGAVIGRNVWIEDPEGSNTFRLFDPTTDVIVSNESVTTLQTAGSGDDLTTDSVPEGVVNLYYTDARVAAWFAAHPFYTTAVLTASATLATRSKNRLKTNNNIVGTAPAAPADFDEILITIETALTGCTFAPNTGQTVNGSASPFALDIAPCSFWFQYNADPAIKNWFVREYRIGSI